MTIIYEPKGKALEYCELAANLYAGCEHGCTYCYAPAATFKSREVFNNPRHRKNVLEQLKKEAPKYQKREILLCFTCDPYQSIEKEEEMTRQAIQILHDNNCNITILTKAGLNSIRDFDILALNGHKYGATLTFINNKDSLEYEPHAAYPESRIQALEMAKLAGITTWVSLEPVIDPDQTMEIVKQTKDFVDVFKVGKWNYDDRSKLLDWKKFGETIIEYFENNNVTYYIKNDLLADMH